MFTKAFLLDTLERAIATFAQTLLGTGTVLDFRDSRTYVAAGIAAGVAVLKCLAATQVGAPDSGSLLPASDDPPQGPAEGSISLVELFTCALILGVLLTIVLPVLL
jgi:hypothetical protein